MTQIKKQVEKSEFKLALGPSPFSLRRRQCLVALSDGLNEEIGNEFETAMAQAVWEEKNKKYWLSAEEVTSSYCSHKY